MRTRWHEAGAAAAATPARTAPREGDEGNALSEPGDASLMLSASHVRVLPK
jgi:hypothetical protein